MAKRQFLQLEGFTKAERISMTAAVSEAINRSGAWITDFHQYSNVVLCINFQVAIADLPKLAAALGETGLNLSQDSLAQLEPADPPTSTESELMGTLQITFIHDEPDLVREIPAVPG